MGRMVTNRKIGKCVLAIYKVLLLTFILAGCTTETEVSNSLKGDIDLDFTMMSRNGNGELSESELKDVIICIFTDNILTDILQQQIINHTRLRFKLASTRHKVKIHFLANTGIQINELVHIIGTHEKDFIATLPVLQNRGTYDLIPMWGTLDFPDGMQHSKEGEHQKYAVKLLRSTAKIEVRLNNEIAENDFKINSIRIYRANDMVLVPNESALHTTDFRVQKPTLPISHIEEENKRNITLSNENGTSSFTFYLAESKGYIESSGDWVDKSTTIVVGGFYRNSNKETFYRVDSRRNKNTDYTNTTYDAPENVVVNEYLRNHFYGFQINKISTPGCEEPETAAFQTQCGTSIEVSGWVPVEWRLEGLGMVDYGAYAILDWVLAQSALLLGVGDNNAKPWIPKEWEEKIGEGQASPVMPWIKYNWSGFYGNTHIDMTEPWKHITYNHDGIGNDVSEE